MALNSPSKMTSLRVATLRDLSDPALPNSSMIYCAETGHFYIKDSDGAWHQFDNQTGMVVPVTILTGLRAKVRDLIDSYNKP